MRTRPPPIVSYFLSLVCMALFATSLASACGHGQRQDTIHASLVALNAARDGFNTWDPAHQQLIVESATSRDDVEAKIHAYREEQAHIAGGFETAYKLLAMAATQTDDPSLSQALTAAADMVASVKEMIGSK